MPVSIVHPPSDSAWALVARDTTALAAAPFSSVSVTIRLDSIPGLKPALHQNSFTAIRAPGAVVGHVPSGGSCTAKDSLPYHWLESGNGGPSDREPTVRGHATSAVALNEPRKAATRNSEATALFMGH